MLVFKVFDLKQRELLQKEIENIEKNLKVYKKYINWKDDEMIWVFEVQKFEKEVELKKCYQI